MVFYERKNEFFKGPNSEVAEFRVQDSEVAEFRVQVIKDALEIAKFLLEERAREITSVIPEEFDLAA